MAPGVPVPAGPQGWGDGWELKAGSFAAGAAGGLFLLPKKGSGVCPGRTPTSQPMQHAGLPHLGKVGCRSCSLHQGKQAKNHHRAAKSKPRAKKTPQRLGETGAGELASSTVGFCRPDARKATPPAAPTPKYRLRLSPRCLHRDTAPGASITTAWCDAPLCAPCGMQGCRYGISPGWSSPGACKAKVQRADGAELPHATAVLSLVPYQPRSCWEHPELLLAPRAAGGTARHGTAARHAQDESQRSNSPRAQGCDLAAVPEGFPPAALCPTPALQGRAGSRGEALASGNTVGIYK